jgi:signal transduction histidine kinase
VAALISMLRKDVMARASHPKDDIALRIDTEAHLIGDEPEIHSAFSNLVDNAAKYTPPEGSIEMRWWVDDEGAHFSVTDTGMGIPAEHIPRLTERFYRVDAGRSRSTGGSGLGLAIVKHVLPTPWRRAGSAKHPRQWQHLYLPFPARARRHRSRGAARSSLTICHKPFKIKKKLASLS